MYLSVGVVLHYAQVYSRSVSPFAAIGITVSDENARNVIRITLLSASFMTCAVMVFHGATPRFLKELIFDQDVNLSLSPSFWFLTFENITFILISIAINLTLRLLILCEAIKTKNYSKLQNKHLALGFLAASVMALIVIMLASIAYQKNYAARTEEERITTRRVIFLIVAVVFPTSVASLHARMRTFVIKRFKARAERLFFEAVMMKRRMGRTLAGALVVPYVDSEDGSSSI